MRFASRNSIVSEVKLRYELGMPLDEGADSTVWRLEHFQSVVLKVSCLSLDDLHDHREMVRMGDRFPHIARLYDVRPLALAQGCDPDSDPWLFCLVLQRFMQRHPQVAVKPPPERWIVSGDVWRQYDHHPDNHIDGVWIDVVRVRRDHRRMQMSSGKRIPA